jgi:hypothetical protein
MKIDEKRFPLLESCRNNFLENPQAIISPDEWDLMRGDIEKQLKLFNRQELDISYITKPIHEKLKDLKNFSKAKTLLQNVPETYGYAIFPEKFKPQLVKDTEDYDLDEFEYDSVLFAYITQETHDLNAWGKLDEDMMEDEEDRKEYLAGRWLLVFPIQNGKIKYCIRDSNICVSEEFGDVHGHEAWDAYGNLLDYIFSYLIFYNFTETENKIIYGAESGKQRKVKIDKEKYLNDTKNNIEIIDTNYFTKIIRTGEFGVSGHFRLQNYGQNNSQTKLIYIEDYKKNGYTREAKQDIKK